MLNESQFALLDLLEPQPAPLSVLARQTGVSARTILRDIDYLNFTLNGTARIQPTGNGDYQLEISDRRRYLQLLQRHDNDDRLLALLLIHPVQTRAQLADALNLPDAWIADRLPKLKRRHERIFKIVSRPGAGYSVDVEQDKRILLLANLFKKDPFVYPLASITPASLSTLQACCREIRSWPEMNGDYLTYALLAVYALRQQIAEPPLVSPHAALQSALDEAGIWMRPAVVSVLAAWLDRLQQRAEAIVAQDVAQRLTSLTGPGQPQIIDAQLITDLTGHLRRCVAMPQWLPESRPGNMSALKAAWPAAFDMSVKFVNLLRSEEDMPLIDSDLPALYFACALERLYSDWTPVVLLAEQHAIATLNKMAIERDVQNCRVVVALMPDELTVLCDEIKPALIINNSHFPLEENQRNVLTIRNVITAAGIDRIKDFLASAFIRQQPEQFSPPSARFITTTASGRVGRRLSPP